MSAVDSWVVFSAKIDELGLSEIKDKFVSQKWQSLATFAFATSFFKEPEPDVFKKEILDILLPSDDQSMAPQVRRLYMQSYAIAAADMARYTSPTAEPKLAFHPEDRKAALKRVRDKLGPAVLVNRWPPFAGRCR